ncbi:hypothetical protein KU39_4p31 (plasmid) [Piscirickettsia salmonis]|uniref:Uncharacterized protein n=1 Tax=Piscirickettsia salmonis TaxID=1238 RepID=A0AAC8VLK8_PISSA|nr:hypothetical protein KU39_4p31 [Piscirickettsia salmonis]
MIDDVDCIIPPIMTIADTEPGQGNIQHSVSVGLATKILKPKSPPGPLVFE